MKLELGYVLAASAGERTVQRINAWEAPQLPGLDHKNMRRWAAGPTWVPPDSQILVRHRSMDGEKRLVTNDRHPPPGFAIEYDLGLVHSFAQPGTRRLIASGSEYFCTPFEGGLDEGFDGLGYVEEAALPMLQPLELRRNDASGEHVLVAGPEDPLSHTTVPVAHLGFIEGYPINPRRAPQNKIDWGVTTLLRNTDTKNWRHIYRTATMHTARDVALGGLWLHPGSGLVALSIDVHGRLTSDLLRNDSASRLDLKAKLRWAGAPLTWPRGRPKAWSVRASASRARMLLPHNADDGRAHLASEGAILGYLRRQPSPGWSPIFSTAHRALPDQYVTRSELEATDMGYKIDGILGYVMDRFADRSLDALPHEIKWASHFGHGRRYVETPQSATTE